jgi:hypothetical protein
MALEATFRNLTTCLHQVNDMMNALHITMEDKPEYDEAAVADDLADKTLELLGFLHEARRSALNARRALGTPPNMDQARKSLTACQDRFLRIEQKFSVNLISYEKLKELAHVGGRSQEWAAWANETKQGIEQCRPPLEQTSKALAACWQELAEYGGKTSISIRTENLGQKIFANANKDSVGSSST